ncbi:MAG: cob(I)yrinic acid a,c-diamide adenosyltransferase [Gammaproteobacteria bacterium]|nr:cob(I)yrinic acid a,c-diamide adenosyltransferase [Gammaproteobacteria bacterium]MDH3467677.1 cob(I)yrinic acid a,c-diamide adenosyltransferase [Gammaproteobacteria bacterium]
MGNRLSKIYTRTGDDGTTGLGDGNRVAKDHPRVEAMGAVDELNSVLGLLLTESLPESIEACLHQVQHTLFDIGGELAIPGYELVAADQPGTLEHMLDTLNAKLAPLKEFILPGGSRAAAYCHLARSVCRRAERRLHTLAASEEVSAVSRQYLNRLSDLLFVIARSLNQAKQHADVLWKHERRSNR